MTIHLKQWGTHRVQESQLMGAKYPNKKSERFLKHLDSPVRAHRFVMRNGQELITGLDLVNMPQQAGCV
jgi:hypothetical protein